MTAQTRLVLTIVIGLAWAALGVANLVKGQTGVGVLYIVIGTVCLGLGLVAGRGRRSR